MDPGLLLRLVIVVRVRMGYALVSFKSLFQVYRPLNFLDFLDYGAWLRMVTLWMVWTRTASGLHSWSLISGGLACEGKRKNLPQLLKVAETVLCLYNKVGGVRCAVL
ncbi:hypothetical protein M758_UG185900 [Ceratodon purpureus]|nr:hypothetical protein M758_UG185900 [Ceratodon purpureus]